MAEQRHATKVSPEGRIVIPSAVRDVLGIQGGDRVQFVVEGSTVRIVSARSVLLAVWTNNTGVGVGDSLTDVRNDWTADNAAVVDKWDRADAADLTGSEDEIEAGLLAQLDLT